MIILICQALISFFTTILCFYVTFNLYNSPDSLLFIKSKYLGVTFNLEPIGMIFLNMVSFLWFLTSLYSIGYVSIKKKINPYKFAFFMMGAVLSACMIATAENLIIVFLFYELLTILTFPLVVGASTAQEISASRKYIITLMGLSLMLFLPAIAIIYSYTGSVSFVEGGVLNSSNSTAALAIIAFLMFIYGVAKAAVMPVHFWLPSAMVAPVPVSALLHAVAVVKSGLLILLKISIYIYGIDYLGEIFKPVWGSNFVIILCSASVLISAIIALRQNNIKMLLAYSTINNMSICLLSVFMFSITSIKAAMLHMIGHAISKLSIFLTTGILESKYGTTNIKDLNGLGKKSNILAMLFTIAAISMIGLHPLAGSIGKSYIFHESMNKADYIAIISLYISMLISAIYFLRLIYRIYFVAPLNLGRIHSTSGVSMIIANILGCICILCYILAAPFIMKFMDKIPFYALAGG